MGGRVHVYGRGVGRCDSFVGGEGEGEGGVSLYRLRDMGPGWTVERDLFTRIRCPPPHCCKRRNAVPGACHRRSPHGAYY